MIRDTNLMKALSLTIYVKRFLKNTRIVILTREPSWYLVMWEHRRTMVLLICIQRLNGFSLRYTASRQSIFNLFTISMKNVLRKNYSRMSGTGTCGYYSEARRSWAPV